MSIKKLKLIIILSSFFLISIISFSFYQGRSFNSYPHIWIRSEIKAGEQRTALSPSGVKRLIDKGLRVVVERSKQRIFKDESYCSVGAELVGPTSYKDKDLSDGSIILGLKELPTDEVPHGTHMYFFTATKDNLMQKIS